MQEFIEKVAQMRRLQKLWYKNHERNTLLAAKSAEYEVDTMLEAFGCPVSQKKSKQVKTVQTQMPKLF